MAPVLSQVADESTRNSVISATPPVEKGLGFKLQGLGYRF